MGQLLVCLLLGFFCFVLFFYTLRRSFSPEMLSLISIFPSLENRTSLAVVIELGRTVLGKFAQFRWKFAPPSCLPPPCAIRLSHHCAVHCTDTLNIS